MLDRDQHNVASCAMNSDSGSVCKRPSMRRDVSGAMDRDVVEGRGGEGMGWEGMGWDEMGWYGMGWDGRGKI